jgi:hypothetical protein
LQCEPAADQKRYFRMSQRLQDISVKDVIRFLFRLGLHNDHDLSLEGTVAAG